MVKGPGGNNRGKNQKRAQVLMGVKEKAEKKEQKRVQEC